MASPHLALSHIAENQNNKETTANAAVDGLDNAMNGFTAFLITGDRTLTNAEFRGAYLFILNGSSPGNFNLVIPADIQRAFAALNTTGSTAHITVSGGGSAAVNLPTGKAGVFYADEDDVYQLGAGSETTQTTVVSTSSTSRAFTEADFAGDVILRYTGGGASSFFLESGLNVTEPVTVCQTGAGQVTFDEGSGVSILEPDGEIKLRGVGSMAQLIPLGSDTYILVGDLTTP